MKGEWYNCVSLGHLVAEIKCTQIEIEQNVLNTFLQKNAYEWISHSFLPPVLSLKSKNKTIYISHY